MPPQHTVRGDFQSRRSVLPQPSFSPRYLPTPVWLPNLITLTHGVDLVLSFGCLAELGCLSYASKNQKQKTSKSAHALATAGTESPRMGTQMTTPGNRAASNTLGGGPVKMVPPCALLYSGIGASRF